MAWLVGITRVWIGDEEKVGREKVEREEKEWRGRSGLLG